MARTPVNRHSYYSLPPVPAPFPIPVHNTGFHRARKLHPQVAYTISPYHNQHIHNMFWTRDRPPYGQFNATSQLQRPFLQSQVHFSLPPARPKPTLQLRHSLAEQQKTQSTGQVLTDGPGPVANGVQSPNSAVPTAGAPSPEPGQMESTPAQERRRRRQRERRRRQRQRQATANAIAAEDSQEVMASPSPVQWDASDKILASPRQSTASGPMHQCGPSNIPGFDKPQRYPQPSNALGIDKHRRSSSNRSQAQTQAETQTQAQQPRKPRTKAVKAQLDAEAGHRFRFARVGEQESWRTRRPVAQANAA